MSRQTGLLLTLFIVAVVIVEAVHAAPDNVDEGIDDLEHLVLNVPDGLDRAKRLAEDHDLNLLGEVIPETNLFHFSVNEHRRKRRSTIEDIHERLSDHPHVAGVHAQEVLTRVRRIPIEEVKTETRSSSVNDGEKICHIKTKATKERPSRRCTFPFSYKGKTYNTCTTDHSSNKAPWCATEVDGDGEVVDQRWGDCSEKTCFTPGSVDNQLQEEEVPQAAAGRPQQPFAPPRAPFPGGFSPFGPSPFGGSFRPEELPQFTRLPMAPHKQPQFPGFNPQQQQPPQQGGLPPFLQGFPFGSDAGSLLKRDDFPPAETDPKLLEVSNELMHHFNDKAWPYMWFLNRGGRGSNGLDMNVDEAWAEGVTGEGVVVSILDDGIERNHQDLKDNYDAKASYDLNDNDEDPMPRYDIINSNKHGTRCAGTVAAVANNSFCAVGIAYNSKVGGIRILDGNILDALEARALSYNRDHIDIYSASWGPDDNGQTIDGPGDLASMALKDGVNKGRKGKGSIFVWASGNGGKYNDSCNCDGYTTSIYTLSVSSVSEEGLRPWYSEACSSSLATTYSSGSKSKKSTERKVVTTDLHGLCTDQHTGTSASSPMAAGIIALTLEANPQLTWRDLQHLVIRTARPRGQLQAPDWLTNGVGLQYSHSYGFGLMDAGKLVKLAKTWKTVPEHVNCTTATSVPSDEESTIGPQNIGVFKLNVNEDKNGCATHIRHLEHVQLHIDLSSKSRRGDISIVLKSPAGTESILLAERPLDNIRIGLSLFKKWPLMSVHFWGEGVSGVADNSSGVWSLLVSNGGDGVSTLNGWSLTFYGTEEDPQPEVPILQAQSRTKPEEVASSSSTTTSTTTEAAAKSAEADQRETATDPEEATSNNDETSTDDGELTEEESEQLARFHST